MVIGPAGDAYYEIGERYRAALVRGITSSTRQITR
jgi:hypothetical protein